MPSPPLPPAGPTIWRTVRHERTVLFVVQNLTTLNRLLDVLPVFEGDLRVQCQVTSDLDDPFVDGLPEAIAGLGLPALSWDQARTQAFDLVVSAGHHGALARLHGPSVLLSHGIGFSKYSPGAAPAGPPTAVYGMDPRWLLRDGEPFMAALGYSHPDQIEQLATAVPAAVPRASLVGDPCFDRLCASAGSRAAFRARLGTGDRRLVLISSTWSGSSLLGQCPRLVDQLVTGLDPDAYQVLLVAHANIHAWHGPHQVRMWLAGALRAGLVLIPPQVGWQAALLAADLVVGDHGSVTVYGAGLGRPVLLAAFPDDEVVPGSAVHRLGALADRLEPGRPPADQVRQLSRSADPERPADPERFADPERPGGPERFAEVRALITSAPGESVRRLRELCYRLLRLDPPAGQAHPQPYPAEDLPLLATSRTPTHG
ncbi:MAG TPA: hypothetical protein VFP72_01520 [Kineosporiaceae bacterium]|nr:hypothetical protein [Kineosporiaceae bacterium]